MDIDISYPGAFLAGLLSFLSPCVLPLVPPYLCFLAGTTLDELTEGGGRMDPALPRRVVAGCVPVRCRFYHRVRDAGCLGLPRSGPI